MKKINELEENIKYLNENIDKLIDEGVGDVLGGVLDFIKNPALKTIKVIKGVIDDTEEEIKKKEDEIEDSKEGQTEEELAAIEELKVELAELRVALGKLRNAKQKDLPYKKVVVKFKGKTKLDIQQMKSPEFKRTLKGTMYFTVFGFDKKNKTVDLKTNSFPDTIIIRLKFRDLKTNIDQKGNVRLIYNKYGAITDGDVVGDEEDIYFRFLTLK